MADVKWIKLKANIFDNRKIKLIRKLPEGDTIALMWFFLITLAGQINDNGQIYITKEVPYTIEELAVAFDSTTSIVNGALMIFEKYGMIEIIDNFINLPNWEKYQNIDGLERIREQTRKRVARHREIKALETNTTKSNATVTLRNAIEEERRKKNKKEEYKEINKEKEDLLFGKSANFIETFNEFRKMRISIKAKMTDRAEKIIITKLNALSNNESEQIAILEQSIANSYKGIFPINQNSNKNSNFNNFTQRNYDMDDLENKLLGWEKNKK